MYICTSNLVPFFGIARQINVFFCYQFFHAFVLPLLNCLKYRLQFKYTGSEHYGFQAGFQLNCIIKIVLLFAVLI